MKSNKQYIVPTTDVFALSPRDRMMQDFPPMDSNSMGNPGSAPIRRIGHPLD